MIKSFNEFFNERSSVHTFLDWVVKEGVYLPDHLLAQEAKDRARNMILEAIPEEEEESFFDTPEEIAALKQRNALRKTKRLPGQKFGFAPIKGRESNYTGQSQNFYNTAVTSIKGLAGRQPQFRKQLATILQSLQGVFKQSQVKPMVGKAADSAAGSNPPPAPSRELTGDEYGDAMKDRYDAGTIHYGKPVRN